MNNYCLILYGQGETTEGTIYWGETRRECLNVAEQHNYEFVIIECNKVNFYNSKEVE